MATRRRLPPRPFPQTELLPGRVLKRRPPALIAVEAEKTARAAEIGAATGLFRAPSVLASNPSEGTLVLERLDDLVPLHSLLLRGTETEAVLPAVGRSLAAIHEHLVLPETMRVPLPHPYAAPELNLDVTVHGDFNTLNLFVQRGTGQLVITDWETSYQVHLLANPAPHEIPAIGPRYFDLAWFVVMLFRRAWFGFGRIVGAPSRAEVFLRSYFREAGPTARPEGFAAYLTMFASEREATDSLFMSRQYWLRHPRTWITWYGAARSFAAYFARRPASGLLPSEDGTPSGRRST